MLKYLMFIILPFASGKFRFDNYSLYKIYPENYEHVKVLQELQNDLRFDFWNYPSPVSEYVNIMSSPKNKGDLENLLNGNQIKFEIKNSNVQEAIDKEKQKIYLRGNPRNMTWDSYYTNDEINAWIDDLALAHPSIATAIVGGRSYEGRDIRGLKISHGPGRRGIFLEGGLHAREWITPAVICFITNELLYSSDEETRAAARDFDWYIFPVTNPDGYVWSHDEFRMWRKNRRPVGNGQIGVDLNRNWNNNWLAVGASVNPMSDTYAGPGPFSEPETRSLSQYIRSIGDQLDIYLSFHSFGQLLLIPFGNTTEPLANYHEAINIGRRAMGALSVRYGTQYVTGNIAEAIYLASGGGIDWVKEQVQVPLVYCYELRDRGSSGFLLPEDQIQPSGEETMDSLLELLHQAKRFEAIQSGSAVHKSFVVVLFSALLFLKILN